MDNNNLPTRAELHRSQKKTKKHFYRRWWFWSIIFILLLIGGGLGGMKMTAMGPFSQTSSTKVTKKKTASKKTTKKVTGITLKQYNGIYLSESAGLPSETLNKIFGKPNTTSNSTVQNLQTDVATWTKIADGQLGANMTVNYANNHAVSKAITGLKVTRSQKLDLTEFNKIQNDQSEAQVINDLGKPNGYSEITVGNTTQKDLTYSTGINGETGANFIINLTNGVVSGKSQTGLK
ncbi:DUF3862 domain-containing protein [Companilactobacillus kimchiensis]|uniref:DUF3862 domain-containing protein n=1 Tax=Companilactobacillus kimchiensis TaxID=993692 RepID=A0A0R2LGG7_9LACO|nr:DUF3862 domain-containing protein [Companilactobacillus kimchiensis]KRN98378.1 hypothetical protein IV57_GL001209 [Companilactobacillus kimchiensis]